MSTKSSIRCAFDDVSHEGFHLYTEAHDDENIYLEMEGFHFEAAILPDITLEKGSPRIVVKVPVEWAKKLQLIE